MPRPKGSKNKVKVPKGAAVDFASAIAAKNAEKDQLNEELASIQAGIADLKAQLKEKRDDRQAGNPKDRRRSQGRPAGPPG